MRGIRANRKRDERAVTLLWVFVLASAGILTAGALVLGSILAHSLRAQALEDESVALTQFTHTSLGPHLVQNGRVAVDSAAAEVLERTLAARPDVLSVKVWQPDGVLAWTKLEPERIGQRFPLEGHLAEVLESGEAEAELEELGGEENEAESRLGAGEVVEVYAPVLGPDGEVLGAYELYADSARLEASIADRKRLLWLTTAAVFLALWTLLALLAGGASRRLHQQATALRERSRQLLDSYARQEESALEAVESLNATVEAKDPYTAGHSQRVERVALAIGAELGLPRDRMDALRFGALFHDIGKIAVTDGILTKPDRLTFWEFAQIKTHSAEGARIVSKFGRLREAVPVVRHHHERWDGEGYPDGLAGEAIPLEAAIVGLADAWDAMTTNRPYADSLTPEAAFGEVRRGRGSQFAPAVVDAFFAAVARQPAEFGLDGGVPLAATG
jgi:putative nucleotidyltransferase with HDIG domain